MLAPYRLRVARPGDAMAVTALLAATYPVCFAQCCPPEVLAVALPLMTRAKPKLLGSGTFYVVEISGSDLVGCGGWSREHPGTGEVVSGLGHIRHFASHPAHSRQGMGRAMLLQCLQDARKSGLRELECLSSPVAEGFYQTLGFATIRAVEIPMAPGVRFPAILMQLKL